MDRIAGPTPAADQQRPPPLHAAGIREAGCGQELGLQDLDHEDRYVVPQSSVCKSRHSLRGPAWYSYLKRKAVQLLFSSIRADSRTSCRSAFGIIFVGLHHCFVLILHLFVTITFSGKGASRFQRRSPLIGGHLHEGRSSYAVLPMPPQRRGRRVPCVSGVQHHVRLYKRPCASPFAMRRR